MTDAVERFMDRHHQLVRQAAKDVAEVQLIDHWLAENSEAMLSSRDEAEKRARRQKPYARYLEVMKLHKQGVSTVEDLHRLRRTFRDAQHVLLGAYSRLMVWALG